MEQYNIIGDIHGRNSWKEIVSPSRINIFLGDYFDPYDDYSYEELKSNFLDIIEFAKTNPDTVLLLGNHDLHYIHHEDTSRMNFAHSQDILNLLLDNIHLFQGVAYAIGEDILISHAGFTGEWCKVTGYCGDGSLRSYVDHANNLLWDGYIETSDGQRGWDNPTKRGMKEFTFPAHAKLSDYYGVSPSQSPVWIRPSTLEGHSFNINVDQIVGHTQVRGINIDHAFHFYTEESGMVGKGRLILCDCLGYTKESLYIDYNGPSDYIYKINHKS